MENQKIQKWYDKNAIVILLLVFFFPVGIYALWKNTKFSRKSKIILTALVGLLFIIGISQQNQKYQTGTYLSNKESGITKSSVVGLYSGPGRYGMGATIELLYGGSFIMKEGGDTAFGDWIFNGNYIDFFMDGILTFDAKIVDDGLIIVNKILGIKKWKKVR